VKNELGVSSEGQSLRPEMPRAEWGSWEGQTVSTVCSPDGFGAEAWPLAGFAAFQRRHMASSMGCAGYHQPRMLYQRWTGGHDNNQGGFELPPFNLLPLAFQTLVMLKHTVYDDTALFAGIVFTATCCTYDTQKWVIEACTAVSLSVPVENCRRPMLRLVCFFLHISVSLHACVHWLKLHWFDLLWICRTTNRNAFDKFTTDPQQIEPLDSEPQW